MHVRWRNPAHGWLKSVRVVKEKETTVGPRAPLVAQEGGSRCYQQPDDATMLAVVMVGMELREKRAG